MPPKIPVDPALYYVSYCKKLAKKVGFPIPCSNKDRVAFESISKFFSGGFSEVTTFLDKVIDKHDEIVQKTWVKSTLTLTVLQNDKVFLTVRSYLENPKSTPTQRFNSSETVGEWA